MKYFYMVSYMIFRRNELIKSGIYLRASESVLNLRQIHQRVIEFCGGGEGNIEVSLINAQRINEDEYNSYLPEDMSSDTISEFNSYDLK